MRRLLILALSLGLLACGGKSSPIGPSTSTPAATQPSGPVALAGSVTAPAGPIVGATVTILDGPSAGRSATTISGGQYRLDNLTAGNANVSATASGHEERRSGIALASGTNTLNFTTRTTLPWTLSGTGNTVFDMPRYFTRVRIFGEWTTAGNSNFIVYIGGRLVVNEILRGTRIYQGVHLTNGGGVTEIVSSNFIRWTFTEER